MCIYIYIYIYICKESERKKEKQAVSQMNKKYSIVPVINVYRIYRKILAKVTINVKYC